MDGAFSTGGGEKDQRGEPENPGVRSPGAMRQWGNHATAFVGQRHFDDPTMLDEAFVL